MAVFVTKEHVSQTFTDINYLLSEASTLGISQKSIPLILHTSLGNEKPFMLKEADSRFFMYRQPLSGFRLSVYNDLAKE